MTTRAADNADGDGASNLREFLAGTDPLDPASVFTVTKAATVGADVQVSCSTVGNRTYQLQRGESVNFPSWVNAGPPTNGTGGVVVLIDSGGATDDAKSSRASLLK